MMGITAIGTRMADQISISSNSSSLSEDSGKSLYFCFRILLICWHFSSSQSWELQERAQHQLSRLSLTRSLQGFISLHWEARMSSFSPSQKFPPIVYISFLNLMALLRRSRPLFMRSNFTISQVSMLNLKISWLKPSDHPPPKMQMFCPSLTAAAFDSGKNSLVVSTVQNPLSGLQTYIEDSRSLPSQPPNTKILPAQTAAAKAHLGVFSPLICFHSYLNMSQDSQPAIPLLFPSQPLITQTFPFRYTQECSFLALTIFFFFSRVLGSRGLNRQQWFDEPPPVMKIYPVGRVQADAQYWISALLMVVRLQTLLTGQRVSSFFLSPKKQIRGLTLWQICTKLSTPENGMTRTGNSTIEGFLNFLIGVSTIQTFSSTFFSLSILSSMACTRLFSFSFFSSSSIMPFSSSPSSSISFSRNFLSSSLLRQCSSVSLALMVLNMRSSSLTVSLQLLSSSSRTQLNSFSMAWRLSDCFSRSLISSVRDFLAEKKLWSCLMKRWPAWSEMHSTQRYCLSSSQKNLYGSSCVGQNSQFRRISFFWHASCRAMQFLVSMLGLIWGSCLQRHVGQSKNRFLSQTTARHSSQTVWPQFRLRGTFSSESQRSQHMGHSISIQSLFKQRLFSRHHPPSVVPLPGLLVQPNFLPVAVDDLGRHIPDRFVRLALAFQFGLFCLVVRLLEFDLDLDPPADEEGLGVGH